MFQGKEWDNLMAGLSKDHKQKTSSQSEISSLFFQLGKIVDKKVAYFWHADTFDKYIQEADMGVSRTCASHKQVSSLNLQVTSKSQVTVAKSKQVKSSPC